MKYAVWQNRGKRSHFALLVKPLRTLLADTKMHCEPDPLTRKKEIWYFTIYGDFY